MVISNLYQMEQFGLITISRCKMRQIGMLLKIQKGINFTDDNNLKGNVDWKGYNTDGIRITNVYPNNKNTKWGRNYIYNDNIGPLVRGRCYDYGITERHRQLLKHSNSASEIPWSTKNKLVVEGNPCRYLFKEYERTKENPIPLSSGWKSGYVEHAILNTNPNNSILGKYVLAPKTYGEYANDNNIFGVKDSLRAVNYGSFTYASWKQIYWIHYRYVK